MAWLLERENTTVATVKFDMEPSCSEIMIPYELLEQRGLAHVSARPTRAAIDIDDQFWPKRARLKTPRKSLPDWVGFCSFWGVSQPFRDCIDGLEPGLHEFRAVEVLRSDGAPFEVSYYAINVRRAISDAVDWQKTDVPSKEYKHGRKMLGLKTLAETRNIVMKRSAIGGSHLWVPDELITSAIAVSNELYTLLGQRKLLTGVACFRVIEE
ncbi:hypothetical protein GR702_19275 [Novosphingobium sp. FGD1]|jgi:hypothetical protein|uniref:Immunity MXAN-0049 protein domain-containing protein n=2 Tax=Sphingomonadaceae TaxID=41297 RepID=A0A7X4GKH3_9SPHN|nr:MULTISPECIES: DUF1629 domain-containing protein [Sphingomonadales]MAF63850.1 hypothetical protein [Blastomonas sp.]MDT7531511.1 hypothetical protein [Sphingopyxis sp. SE2]MYL99904.1 hypothetical protein [Novosphingobium silvae]PXW67273.1 hypothetical protein C7451_1339 [Blastomonas natatoria]|tara:strand:- start:545 stop:1177 length:633 start_codon:yes stop_codon:yes gene_type:complete